MDNDLVWMQVTRKERRDTLSHRYGKTLGWRLWKPFILFVMAVIVGFSLMVLTTDALGNMAVIPAIAVLVPAFWYNLRLNSKNKALIDELEEAEIEKNG